VVGSNQRLVTIIGSGVVDVEISPRNLPQDHPTGIRMLEKAAVWIALEHVDGREPDFVPFQVVGELAKDSPVKRIKKGKTYLVTSDIRGRTVRVERWRGSGKSGN
jgi:hypothetical protein